MEIYHHHWKKKTELHWNHKAYSYPGRSITPAWNSRMFQISNQDASLFSQLIMPTFNNPSDQGLAISQQRSEGRPMTDHIVCNPGDVHGSVQSDTESWSLSILRYLGFLATVSEVMAICYNQTFLTQSTLILALQPSNCPCNFHSLLLNLAMIATLVTSQKS
jgi:hypothetical protein